MASFKILKSIAHNFCHSFLSGNNFVDNIAIYEELQDRMKKYHISNAEIDFITKEITPKKIISKYIIRSVNDFSNDKLNKLLNSQGWNIDEIKSIKIYLTMEKDGYFWYKRIYHFLSTFEVITISNMVYKNKLHSFFENYTPSIIFRFLNKYYFIMPRNK